MGHAIDAEPFPKGPLYGAIALVVLTLSGVAFVRVTGGAETVAEAPLSVRELRFADRADGGIDVRDGRDGTVVAYVAPGTNGFLRSTLRGLARERMRRGLGPDTAFSLATHNDGRITLDDPATGRHIDLAAFGPTNEAAFARFISDSSIRNTPDAPRGDVP